MKDKNFGIVPEELRDIDKVKELEEFLYSKKVLIWVKKGSNIIYSKTDNLGGLRTKVVFDPKNEGYEFTNSFVLEVYMFLLDHYKNGLRKIHLFINDFENNTFGMKESDKQEIALKHFNDIYPCWTANLATIMEYTEDRKLKSENHFNKLSRSRVFIQENFKHEIELLSAYLIGDLDYFNSSLFESNIIIKEMFDFENDLLILIELNKRLLY
jgi:hypothetical protein